MTTTRVKICGITNIEDGMAATAAGADMLGFVFYPKSARLVTVGQARHITDAIRAATTHPPVMVGVFVDVEWREVDRVLGAAGLDLAQLHGSEPPVEISLLAPRAFKALRPQSRGDAEAAAATYAQALPPTDPATATRPSYLIDTFVPWAIGGTGRRADWHAARTLAERYPVLLAGGLTTETVADAIAVVQPWGVDVSSGVESAPGQKDHAKLRAFIDAVRASQAQARHV